MRLASPQAPFLPQLILALAGIFLSSPALLAQEDVNSTPVQKGTAALAAGDYDQAIEAYTQAIQSNPQDASAYFQRAVAYVKADEDDKAVADLARAIQINPRYRQAYYRRSFIYMIRGNYDQATADLNQAIQINPEFTQAYFRRACVEMMSGQDDPALSDLDRVIEIDPNFSQAYVRRSFAFMLKGDYAQTIAAMNQILQANPKAAGTYNRLAWLQATCPDASFRDGRKAIDNATTACQLTGWRMSSFLDTLAAAYAEAGDFINAMKCENLAIATQGDKEFADTQKSRLALYQSYRPYHVDKYNPHFEAVIN